MEWSFGVDLVIPVRVVHASGSAYSLSGPVVGVLGFKRRITDALAFFQLGWTVTDGAGGLAEFAISREQRDDIGTGYLVAGIRFRDDDTNVEDDILGPSRTEISPQVAVV